jgi:2-polyprenyl-6-methoxyphenol hydroxylase-like FAD-dependent oxidoreductase
MTRTSHHHAVVIGASVAGLLTARVLADHFTKVTVLDRDTLPVRPGARKGVPQGRHAHALLSAGQKTLAELFPGLADELRADGAAQINFNEGRWYQAGGYRARVNMDRTAISASRPLLEHHVRGRVAALPNVTIMSGVSVDGLLYDGRRVRGVQVCHNDTLSGMTGDLVVDCSGRSSRAATWMDQIGYPSPTVDHVRCDLTYGTRIFRRTPGDMDATFAVTIESPPHGTRASFVMPIENDRWIVTLADRFGAPATDERSFRSFAVGLPAPETSEVVTRAEPLSPLMTHRQVSSQRRRYEKLRRVPAGFVALGDSICSFNPLYGQGMSSAALQAKVLGEVLARFDAGDDRLPKRFYRQAAKVIATPWKIAVGADFAYPETTGPKPFGTDLMNRYLARVLVAARGSADVNGAMLQVQQLTAPPSSLVRPTTVRAVRKAARQVERQQAEPGPAADPIAGVGAFRPPAYSPVRGSGADGGRRKVS